MHLFYSLCQHTALKKKLDITDYLIHSQKLSAETHFLIFYIFLSFSYRSSFPNRNTSKCGETNETNTPSIMNAALYPPDKNEVKYYAHLPYYYVM